MKKYPLVDLEKTETPVFWIYNNLAHLYDYYNVDCFTSDREVISKIRINESESTIKYIEDLMFEMIVNKILELPDSKFRYEFKNWDSSEFSITLFSVYQYKIKYPDELDNAFKINGYLCEETIFDFEEKGLYPNSEQLDLLVKKYLKEIEPDLSLKEELESRENGYHFTRDNIYSFFLFHFNSYKGDVHDFIKHCLEITNEVWSVKSPKNIKRQKYFDNWVSETLNQYPEIDPKKFYDDYETSKTENLDYTQPITIEELNEIDYTEDLVFNISGLELFLNDKRDTFTGSVYDFVKNVIEISKQNWKESFSDLKRKNIVKNWVEKTITELNLDKMRLGIEPTPEPPQPVESVGIEHKKLTLTGKKVTIYHIFKQLIDRKFIGENAKEVAQFLIQNVNGFENDDINTLSTEISRNRETNLEKGTVGISKENRINLD